MPPACRKGSAAHSIKEDKVGKTSDTPEYRTTGGIHQAEMPFDVGSYSTTDSVPAGWGPSGRLGAVAIPERLFVRQEGFPRRLCGLPVIGNAAWPFFPLQVKAHPGGDGFSRTGWAPGFPQAGFDRHGTRMGRCSLRAAGLPCPAQALNRPPPFPVFGSATVSD